MIKITPPSSLAPDPAPATSGGLYEHDFVAWLDRQVALIRAGELHQLDLANLAEELEDMSKSKRRELRNRLETLLMHLLKYEIQPNERTKSWLSTILEQRQRIVDVLDENPSLRSYLADLHDDVKIYTNAVERARIETGLPANRFPTTNPYGPPALKPDFWPGPGPHPDL
jgi:hypothetical protein